MIWRTHYVFTLYLIQFIFIHMVLNHICRRLSVLEQINGEKKEKERINWACRAIRARVWVSLEERVPPSLYRSGSGMVCLPDRSPPLDSLVGLATVTSIGDDRPSIVVIGHVVISVPNRGVTKREVLSKSRKN